MLQLSFLQRASGRALHLSWALAYRATFGAEHQHEVILQRVVEYPLRLLHRLVLRLQMILLGLKIWIVLVGVAHLLDGLGWLLVIVEPRILLNVLLKQLLKQHLRVFLRHSLLSHECLEAVLELSSVLHEERLLVLHLYVQLFAA